jgi:predicted membrane protein
MEMDHLFDVVFLCILHEFMFFRIDFHCYILFFGYKAKVKQKKENRKKQKATEKNSNSGSSEDSSQSVVPEHVDEIMRRGRMGKKI